MFAKNILQLLLVFSVAGVISGWGSGLKQGEFPLALDALRMLRSKTIGEQFFEWKDHQVAHHRGTILEVSTATAVEKFSRESRVKMLGLPLMTKTSSISVPATYRFHIDLCDDWTIAEDGKRLIVTAPSPRPSLPVAFDTCTMEKEVTGWGKYLRTDDMAELEATITCELARRATDSKTLISVREESRESIAKFLQTWLLSEKRWKEGHFEELVVLFHGEKPNAVRPVAGQSRSQPSSFSLSKELPL